MELFHKIDDACVITLARGVYHQRPLFRRGDALYAGCGGGFVRLVRGGGTSVPHISWKAIDPGPGRSFSEDVFTVTLSPALVAAE